ncbi:hypothetical protein [Nostoc sp. MG11]|uniref:hypothetical protein n=1 Tax=Nostoc sp. MG11 TaxID=2721166 RepID=UPI0018673E80|nr:hypothetical protein [Nostoc sp. MG11]
MLRLREQAESPRLQSQPDYEAIRSRTLTKLKLGRQSAAAKAIDAFIRELDDK